MDNNITNENQAPKWFSIVAIIAVIWNIMGLLAFISHLTMTPEMLAELPVAEQALYKNIPQWAMIAFAFAVIAGFVGSVGLLLKKGWAGVILLLSLIGVIVQMYHSFFVIDSIAVYGPGGMVMPIMVILIAVYLVWLSNKAKQNQWYK